MGRDKDFEYQLTQTLQVVSDWPNMTEPVQSHGQISRACVHSVDYVKYMLMTFAFSLSIGWICCMLKLYAAVYLFLFDHF